MSADWPGASVRDLLQDDGGVFMERDLVELGCLADENLARSWAAFGRAAGAVGGADRCTFVATGIPAAFFNGAYAAGTVADPERVVADALGFMAVQRVPWLLWVREGVDDALLDAGRRAGLTDAGGPPAMALPSIPAIPPAPDDLEVRLAILQAKAAAQGASVPADARAGEGA